jgi:Na+-transporting methylmalonyl-CoA/oxaloacetate decarboxylase gamma subunit
VIALLVILAAVISYIGWRVARDQKEKKEQEHAARKWGK